MINVSSSLFECFVSFDVVIDLSGNRNMKKVQENLYDVLQDCIIFVRKVGIIEMFKFLSEDL